MITYDQLTICNGGPWIGSIAVPKLNQGNTYSMPEINAQLPKQSSSNRIAITGGEPLMHPDIIDIIANCAKNGYTKILARTSSMMLKDINFIDYCNLVRLHFCNAQ